MCKSPGTLADGTQIACRNCSLCAQRAKDDWTGRNIAESKTAKYAYRLDLTYGRNRHGDVLHERSVLLTYSDVQKFLKLLRRHGLTVRYFVTGEYGNQKGRAHWHLLLYTEQPIFQKAGWDQYGNWLDNAADRQRCNWVRVDEHGQAVMVNGEPAYWWPYGFVFFEQVTFGSIQYCTEYVLKELDHEGRQYHLGMSKKPPIGQSYFEQLAERMVEAGIAPQTPEYKFPGVTRRTKAGGRKAVSFWLKGRPLEMYLDHFIAKWAELKGGQPRPRSDLVDLYERYGRVVHDAEAAFGKADEEYFAQLKWDARQKRIAEGLPDPPGRRPKKEYDGSLWAPLMRNQQWWDTYFRGFGDGEARQREVEDVEYWSEWLEAYFKCIEAGAEPGNELKLHAEDVGRALANHHRFKSVDEWHGWRKGGCRDPEIDQPHEFGPSKLDRAKAAHQAFHAQPKAGPDAASA